MQAALGSLLLLWSAIERQAMQQIAQPEDCTQGRRPLGPSELLRGWRRQITQTPADGSLRNSLAETLCDQLEQPRAVRNGVCHGLVGVRASGPEQPACMTWDTAGTLHQITWDELQTIFRFLSKVPHAMSMIGDQSERCADTPEKRDWWASEYGLILTA